MKFKILAVILIIHVTFLVAEEVKLSIETKDSEDNSTFVATDDWQEIKPGQKVPSGLHYRINLTTGKKEAKILVPDDSQPTSLQETPQEQSTEDESTIDAAKSRLEEALKNIPYETLDKETEKNWKNVQKKFKTYDQIKKELKDVNLVPKTEAEMLTQFMDEFSNSTDKRLEILRDLEFLLHSIDNALLFISKGGIEKILIPHLVNQTDVAHRVVLMQMLGAISQNNLQAKKYILEKTNLVNDLVVILDKYETQPELSAGLFSVGSLIRSNNLVKIETLKKLFAVLFKILTKDSTRFDIKTKIVVLIDDLLMDSHTDLQPFIESSKICQQLATFFELNKNLLITYDIDATEKISASFLNLCEKCKNIWSELPMMRHTLLVLLNNFKTRLNEAIEEDSKFVFELVIEHLENLNQMLYGDLKISKDDLSQRYNDEL